MDGAEWRLRVLVRIGGGRRGGELNNNDDKDCRIELEVDDILAVGTWPSTSIDTNPASSSVNTCSLSTNSEFNPKSASSSSSSSPIPSSSESPVGT